MSNTFSPDFADIWAKEQQMVFYKTNVAMKIADTSFKSQLSKGDVLNRPYRSSNYVQAYTRGTSITIDDKTDTQEYLTVNKQFATGFYVDDFDKIQSNYDLIANYAKDDATYLSNQIDADVLAEVANATSVVDDGTLGGTTGNGISLNTSNVINILSHVKKALKKLNVSSDNVYGVISPEFEQILVEYIAGRDTSGGDTVGENGYIGKYFGIKFYVSNQLYSSAVLALATDPSNTNTIVIAGVTFTAVTTIGTTAGNFLVGTNADTSRAVLTALINSPGTTSASQVALSTANQRLFANATATNDNTANTMTVVFKGIGVLDVSETLTDSTDCWTAATQLQWNLFGVTGNPTLVVQADPSVQVRDVETKLGKNVLNGVLYGVKTFVDNAKQMVAVKIRCDGYNA